MIVLLSKRTELVQALHLALGRSGVECVVAKAESPKSVDLLYAAEVTGVVVDPAIESIPEFAWHDMLASLGRRLPVVVLGQEEGIAKHQGGRHVDTVTWLKTPTAEDVIAVLDSCGALGGRGVPRAQDVVPLFNAQIPLHMLKTNGALSVLTINASAFRKVAIEYGTDVYHRLQDTFQHILFDLWGSAGSFRSADVLCRRAAQSNTYYVFLEQSRTTNAVPAPGILERLADRLVVRLQNLIWNELLSDKKNRRLPECISVVPEFSVGHATAIHNPCVDSVELLEHLLESSFDVARVQLRRMKDRQKELMQTLIQAGDLLHPNYQGVFNLQEITKEIVDEVTATKSIAPLASHIYGFESLIRVRREVLDTRVANDGLVFLESRFLRPDVLFALAQSTKVALELDQACLQLGVEHATGLPGVLMVNILPRNLYHIDRLQHMLTKRGNIIFEVSESEAISNFDLMMTVRTELSRMNMGIATDDFGKGFAGLDRIIKIRPDLIKLDRSLIEDIHEDLPKQAFVRGLVEAAKIAKSNILAEGVERWEEAIVLKEMGINLIQGFLLHRPQSAEMIKRDLESAALKSPPKLHAVA